MAIREDLKNLQAMIQNMDKELSLMTDMVDTTIRDIHDLDIEMKRVLSKKTMEEIESMTEEDVIDCLTEGFTGEGDNTNVLNMRESYESISEEPKRTFTEYAVAIFKEIKQSLIDVENLKVEKENITKEVGEITDNYFNYVNSAEYKKKKLDRIKELKAKAEEEHDEKKKKEINDMLTNIENTETLQFLFDRIEKVGEKEISSIIDTFFTPKRSEVIMEKFASRLPKYGYNNELYKMFFNLEEKFLPEEYHDLNNMFLFVVMRYISYTDTYSKVDSLYVSSILIKLYNLLYHNYETQEQENEFIELIKRMDDYFMPEIERFTKHNITSPNHPQRKERDRQYEEKRRLMIISSLENEGIEVDTTLETEELRKMLQDVIDKKQNESVDNADTIAEVIAPSEMVPVNKEDEEGCDTEPEVEITVEKVENEELEKFIDEIEENEEVQELDAFMESIDVDELKKDAVEIVLTNPEENSDTTGTDDEFVVERRTGNETQTEPETTEIEVWKDSYDCYYIEDNGTYGYCDKDGNVIEEGVPEDTVLKLISGGNVTKATIRI